MKLIDGTGEYSKFKLDIFCTPNEFNAYFKLLGNSVNYIEVPYIDDGSKPFNPKDSFKHIRERKRR